MAHQSEMFGPYCTTVAWLLSLCFWWTPRVQPPCFPSREVYTLINRATWPFIRGGELIVGGHSLPMITPWELPHHTPVPAPSVNTTTTYSDVTNFEKPLRALPRHYTYVLCLLNTRALSFFLPGAVTVQKDGRLNGRPRDDVERILFFATGCGPACDRHRSSMRMPEHWLLDPDS